jgi:branched-chain amino acid transport system ATP-binding protein
MLTVKSLHVNYGAGDDALDGVSLTVGAGECVTLVGANGAGKTTLLRTISGLIRMKSGGIDYDGADVSPLAVEARVQAGLIHVPERRRIFPGLTVEENLIVATSAWRGFGASCASELERVYALFPRLLERRTQRGWSLSGGEQQMLAIGRALMARPKLLLLDEPSLGLAPLIAQELYRQIAAIGREGVSILVVEQNTVLALSVAARGYVIEGGRITLAGTAQALLNDPRVTQAFLGG